ETHAAPADPSGNLGALLEGKRSDLGRRARIDGSADGPVGGAEFDVFDFHFQTLGFFFGEPVCAIWAMTKSQFTSRKGDGMSYSAARSGSSTVSNVATRSSFTPKTVSSFR